ncbi:hypothetical protein [Sorangium sp. So ce1078]|uniref:hypothetical protein n=1 Tax=Sorangium sp. So ce1078 TaxID=3133329 RepID=UPI003F642129
MKRALTKVRAVFCAGLFAAGAGGCNALIGLEVGETDPGEIEDGASSSSAGGSSAVSAGAGGGGGAGSGGGELACNDARPGAIAAPSGLWGDTMGVDVGDIAALDDAVTAVINETASFTVARWSSTGVRQSDYGLSAPGVWGTHLAIGAGVAVVAGEATRSVDLADARCRVGPHGGASTTRPSFVAALDAAGRCAWAWSIDSDGGTAARGLAATSDAVVFAVESVDNGRSFGPCDLKRTVTEESALVVALDPARGACKWSRNLGTRAGVTVRALAAGATSGVGSVAVVGDYDSARGSVAFGDTPRAAEGRGIFVARYASRDGAPQKVTMLRLQGDQRVAPHGAAELPGGDVAIAGSYTGALDFEDTCPAMPDAGGTDNVFVARVSEHGAVWSRGFGDAATVQTAAGVAVDDAGSIHVTGLFTGEIDLGAAGKLAVPSGRQAGFLIRLDGAGHVVSASTLEGDGTADLRIVAAGGALSEPLYVAGNLTGTLELGLDERLGSQADAEPRGFIARLSGAP